VLTIALVASVESLLSAVAVDKLHDGKRANLNRELLAQGAANTVSGVLGGLPVTGVIVRSSTNVAAGARTRASAVLHGCWIAVCVLLFAGVLEQIPLAALAAVLLWVAFNMAAWRELRALRQFSMFYRAILLTTLTLTVVFDLTVAVEVGLVLSALFYIYRISSLTKVEPIALTEEQSRRADGTRVGAWELFGSIFFASVTKIEGLLDPARPLPEVVVLEMHKVINIDTTGLDALEALLHSMRSRGGRLILADLNEQPMSLLDRSGFLRELGPGNIFENFEAALRSARD
jgi:SulP family sulfate permease